jgi:hypothetical protein
MTGQTNQIIMSATGQYGPPCRMKIIDGWWQDAGTEGDTLTFTDALGNTYTYRCTQAFYPTDLGKLDWLVGPITVTVISSGTAYLIMGNK